MTNTNMCVAQLRGIVMQKSLNNDNMFVFRWVTFGGGYTTITVIPNTVETLEQLNNCLPKQNDFGKIIAPMIEIVGLVEMHDFTLVPTFIGKTSTSLEV